MKRWHNNGRLQWGKLEVSGGLLFWIALLWYLGYDAVLACFLPAAALHELGHILAVWQCGGSVRRLRLSLVGAELVLDGRERLSYRQELWVAAAGPLTNLVTGVLAAQLWRSDHGEGLLLFAGASLVLGCFNLLPLEALDGGQMLCAALSGLGTPKAGEKIQTAASWLVAAGLLGGGAWLLWTTRYNLSLLAVGLWAAVSMAKPWEKSTEYFQTSLNRMRQAQRRRRQ